MPLFSRSSNKVLENSLKEATSKNTWNVPNSTLTQIAQQTYAEDDCTVILSFCWNLLQDKKKEWRQAFKCLVLLEALLKHGSDQCTEEIKNDVWKVQQWKEYRHMEQGRDVASGIREKASSISELCNDRDALQKERSKAQALSQKMMGVGTTGPPSTGESTSQPVFHSTAGEEKRKKSSKKSSAKEFDKDREPPELREMIESDKNAAIERFCNATGSSKMGARQYLERNKWDVHRAADQYLADETGESASNRGKKQQQQRKPSWVDQKQMINSVTNFAAVSEERATKLLEMTDWDVNAAIDFHLTQGRDSNATSRQVLPPGRQAQKPAQKPASVSSDSSSSSSSGDESPPNTGPQTGSGGWNTGSFNNGQGGWPGADGFGQGKGGFPGGGQGGGFNQIGAFGGNQGCWPPQNAPGGWGSQGGPPSKGGPFGGSFGNKGGTPNSGFGAPPQANPWNGPPQGQNGAMNRSQPPGQSYSGAQNMSGFNVPFGTPSAPSRPPGQTPGGNPFSGNQQANGFGGKGDNPFGQKGGFQAPGAKGSSQFGPSNMQAQKGKGGGFGAPPNGGFGAPPTGGFGGQQFGTGGGFGGGGWG